MTSSWSATAKPVTAGVFLIPVQLLDRTRRANHATIGSIRTTCNAWGQPSAAADDKCRRNEQSASLLVSRLAVIGAKVADAIFQRPVWC